MANFFPVLLFLSVFIASRVHARESQFFSKFTANPGDALTQVGPSDKQAASLEKQAQDPPSFVAQSQDGYGLYGHGTGQLPPSEADTASTTTSFPDEPYYNKDVFATKDDEVASDTKALLHGSSFDTAAATEDGYFRAAAKGQGTSYFPTEEQGFRGADADARLQGRSYTATGSNYGNVVANAQNNYYAVGSGYPAKNARQQQGLSDTRFLENGKYYYNIDDGEKYDPIRKAELGGQQGYYPSEGKAASTYEYGNNGNNYYAGGYEPLKELEAFRATRNVDGGFKP
ncbi:hypothetical protein MLD38_021151 [Melastoma candidum]|uniref:Uncharacterized protein n=1 Tax=Melastoma candidum TaxID=119954 RepID=A0ACB9QFQ0_9MYRT|nr:hypothetical protein MLD38_021151 [Melastoma candidum]